MTIEVGGKAPDASFTKGDGTKGKVSDFRGSPLVLYFYPKDSTTGCTREAGDFTALASDFSKLGAQVVGASKDSIASHEKFAKKYDLAVTLVSDLDDGLCDAFGVWGEKTLYGKKYMGIERATFLIDAGGEIVQTWRKVKVASHAEAVLDSVRALG